MDEDRDDLISQLCTRIAMVMEDHCDLALIMGGMAPHSQRQAITELEVALIHMTVLLNAAKALRDQALHS